MKEIIVNFECYFFRKNTFVMLKAIHKNAIIWFRYPDYTGVCNM